MTSLVVSFSYEITLNISKSKAVTKILLEKFDCDFSCDVWELTVIYTVIFPMQ